MMVSGMVGSWLTRRYNLDGNILDDKDGNGLGCLQIRDDAETLVAIVSI